MHLLIDSKAFSAIGPRTIPRGKKGGSRRVERHKHVGQKKHLWRKRHLGMDEETLEIHAVGVTIGTVDGASMLPDLLDQSPPDLEIATVTADWGL